MESSANIAPEIWIYAGGAAFLLLLIVLFIWRRSSVRKGSSTLILGLCESGKTALWWKLRSGGAGETFTSMKENDDTFALHEGNGTYHIIDFPGHQRLRPQFKDFLPITGKIIFVIDSATFLNNVASVADFLYAICTHPNVYKAKIPILVACNKSEMITAREVELIKTDLEVEMENMKSTVDIGGIGGKSESKEQVDLGDPESEFTFDQLPFDVTFTECSVAENEIDAIKSFIES
eukprot:TRINITY_DN2277_c0_g8_i1.p1 TRINITY_DN2277_c0_g8~~TRINITY_DN2277_c0_g8_i1.p1  ORF type:complete len:235 (+),score=45.07 TRINITY_DN2277_c0_g8_i1:25-729(+)